MGIGGSIGGGIGEGLDNLSPAIDVDPNAPSDSIVVDSSGAVTIDSAITLDSLGIRQNTSTSSTNISGGSARNLGSNAIFFGENEASNAGDWLLRTDATNVIFFDKTAGDIGINGNVFSGTGSIFPSVTETSNIGSASLEYDNIFLQNAPTVSDARRKEDLGPITEATKFIRLLEPRLFKYKSKTIAGTTETTEQQKTKEISKEITSYTIVNGKAVEKKEIVSKHVPVFKEVPVKGKPSEFVKFPVMETITTTKPDTVVTHGRPHAGFMAQAVKQAMVDAGIEDLGLYAYHEDDDTHVLRLNELFGPLVAAFQELDKRLSVLENK